MFLCAAVAGCAVASASFELMIVTDASTGFHRYDATTGTYLGSFGNGQSTGVKATWADLSTNRFYSMSNAGIRAFNYSTGQYYGLVNVTASANYAENDRSGNFVSAQGTNTLNVYNLSGSDSVVTLPTGVSSRWVYLGDDDRWYVGDSNNGGRILRSSGLALSGWTVIASGIGATYMPATFRHVEAHLRPGFTGFENGLVANDTTSTDAFFGLDTSYNFTSVVAYGIPSLTSRAGSARGHLGIYHVGGTSVAGTTGVRYVDDGNPSGVRTFTTTAVANPTAVTVVLAPEPGSLIVIGAGLAALVRRRRKS